MKKIRALSVGAVLWDVINEREYIGGAPFNVAVNLKRLGAESAFVTCVGRDARGDRALEKIREYGVHSFAQRDERFATGRRGGSIGRDGQRDLPHPPRRVRRNPDR